MTFHETNEIEEFVARQEGYGGGDLIIKRVVKYLGGQKIFKVKPRSQTDVHDLIVKGIPGEAVAYVVARTQHLDQGKVASALGMSTRTIQRKKEHAPAPLSPEQGDRTWKFSELMVRATTIMGSQEQAERWFDSPAMALDQRRPIDLLGSSVGASVVEELLGRLEHGVYT